MKIIIMLILIIYGGPLAGLKHFLTSAHFILTGAYQESLINISSAKGWRSAGWELRLLNIKPEMGFSTDIFVVITIRVFYTHHYKFNGL